MYASVRTAEATFASETDYAYKLRQCNTLEGIRDIHAQVGGESSTRYLMNLLVHSYGRHGSVGEAWSVFRGIQVEQRNVFSWTIMITAFTQNGHHESAVECYREMLVEGVKPTAATFVSVLAALAVLGDASHGRHLHECIVACRMDAEVAVATALINMYAKCGLLPEARLVFDAMPVRNMVTWTCMVGAFAQLGYCREAMETYQRMDLEGMHPDRVAFIWILDISSNLSEGRKIHQRIKACGIQVDVILGTSLLSMYGRCGSLDDALTVFSEMKTKNLVAWNATLAACVLAHESDCSSTASSRGMHLYQLMLNEGMKPDEITVLTALRLCARLSDVRAIHQHANQSRQSTAVCNALITTYTECGSPAEAFQVFESMNSMRDVISWNAMISGDAQQGNSCCLELTRRMALEGVTPNEVSFVHILYACSHAGLFGDGARLFAGISQDYGLTPTYKHYGCLVDLLARAGWLSEAVSLVSKMPGSPNALVWKALLGGCRTHGDVHLGAQASMSALGLEPGDSAPYVLLLETAAAASS